MRPGLLLKISSVYLAPRELRAWVCCILILAGMVYSPFLQSAGLILLVLLALFDWRPEREFPIAWNPRIRPAVGDFFSRPDYWAPILYFLVVFMGIYAVEAPDYWLARLRIKAPFLFLPFVFFLLPPFSKRLYGVLWYFLILLLALTSLGVLLNYLLHAEAIQKLIEQGQPIPMPCNHIRYSLLQAMGVAGGMYLLDSGFRLRYRWERPVLIGLLTWLILAQHLIAVRSGLAVLYAVLALATLHFLWKTRRRAMGIALLALLLLSPVLAYRTVPSFRTRIDYARYDLERYLEDRQVRHLSDAARWVSWELGWDLFRESPVLGVGAGNLRMRMEEAYAARYLDAQNYLMPHNQFLFVAAGSGLVGLVLFLCAFLIPLLRGKHYRDFLFAALHINVFLSCIVEATLENAMGVAFFIFFWGIILRQLTEKTE